MTDTRNDDMPAWQVSWTDEDEADLYDFIARYQGGGKWKGKAKKKARWAMPAPDDWPADDDWVAASVPTLPPATDIVLAEIARKPARDAMPTPVTVRDRYRGAMLGLAAGDAFGSTLEFSAPGTFAPHRTMTGGGPWGLKPGAWTDDTSMALCLAESLVTCGGMDAGDQMWRYARWNYAGYMSAVPGVRVDIGGATSAAIHRYMRDGNPMAGSTDPRSAGNGSIMRLAPVPLFFARADTRTIMEMCMASSTTTHAAAEAVDACAAMGVMLAQFVRGMTKAEVLAPSNLPVMAGAIGRPLAPKVEEIVRGSYREKMPPAITGDGYVIESLEAALWALAMSDTWEDGVMLAANLGRDADTTAAVYGQLAGALYGADAVMWQDVLVMRDVIVALADGMLTGAQARA